MAVTGRSEFSAALNQVAHERGLDPFEVLDTIKAAILAAYRRDYNEEETEAIEVSIDSDNGEVQLMKEGKDVTPPGFGRIAAQTAKQVLLQRIREAEKSAILTDYSKRVGTIVSGMVQRQQGPAFIIDIGRAEAVMPPREQVKSEYYYLNQRLKFYISEIREHDKRSEIIVSRAHPDLVKGLFQQEVPEITAGSVEIKALAREAGFRTKIAVASNQLGVDPVGSCVGQRGNRIQTVINELNGEKIDVIPYNDDIIKFITAALQPAKNVRIEIVEDEEGKKALAHVPDDELSLAIGSKGQNVRLAAKLTGYRIEIVGKDGQSTKPAESNAQTEETPTETGEEPIAENAESAEQETVAEENSETAEAPEESTNTVETEAAEETKEDNTESDEKEEVSEETVVEATEDKKD